MSTQKKTKNPSNLNLNESKKRNVYQIVTDKILTLLSSDNLKLNPSWLHLGSTNELAMNAITKKRYTGVNKILLGIESSLNKYPSHYWLTFKQVGSLGGQVKKGSKSALVVYWNFIYKDANGKKMNQKECQKMTFSELYDKGINKIGYLKSYNLFNVMQTENLPSEFYEFKNDAILKRTITIDEKAEEIINSTSADIEYSVGDKAFYTNAFDKIVLPYRSQFLTSQDFYSIAFHELAHWTSNASRLNRKLYNFKDNPIGYAHEELIAELSAAFLCSEVGFSKKITSNAAYIKGWLDLLNSDNKAFFKAASAAEKVSEYILSFSK